MFSDAISEDVPASKFYFRADFKISLKLVWTLCNLDFSRENSNSMFEFLDKKLLFWNNVAYVKKYMNNMNTQF